MNRTPPETTGPDDLLRALVREPVAPMPAREADELRARILQQVTAPPSTRAVPWAARVRRAAVAMAIAAGVPLLVWALTGAPRIPGLAPAVAARIVAVSGPAEVAHGGTATALASTSDLALSGDEEIRTGPGASVRASLATGAVVDVGPAARLRLAPPPGSVPGTRHDRVDLLAGRIDVRVPKLTGGDEVRVQAGGVTVVVHGTRFSVERSAGPDGSASRTSVTVTEGKVAVYAGGEERLLTAGAEWNLTDPAGDAGAGSTLALENALLTEAMQQRLAGHPDRSADVLRELLQRYPSSTLTDTARVELARALADALSGHP
jgi:ferric-dicitrate binding protein FerR (iron transport regulator)